MNSEASVFGGHTYALLFNVAHKFFNVQYDGNLRYDFLRE